MGYLLLFITVLLGVIGNINVKLSEGFTRKLPTVLVFVFYALCTYFLTLTVQYLEVGVVYAVWSGVGIAIVAIIGTFFFNESKSLLKFV
jgi:multidrug transporter EmrE-like cation transporter